MSRIGKKPIAIPQGVKAEVKDNAVFVEGPKGKLQRSIANRITVSVKDGQVLVGRVGDSKVDRSLHGLYRALIQNMIKGVNEGYSREMEIIGVGFKAAINGSTLTMNLGFSHPVEIAIPEGIKMETPKPTQVIVRGIDKELVGRLASEIRRVYPPEPYKGKGIRYLGERVKKKVGKAAAK
jgi:large subunit ribosomal protein L6